MAAVRAPEIDVPGVTWLNVAAPLSLATLKGRLVILDFWTFCCVNCLHVLPALRRVEAAFPEEVVVIGVHSPKFAAEKQAAGVEQAIARHRIAHPVIHDPDMRLWREYAVRAWPTLVFVSPTGRVVGHAPGEPDTGKLLQAVERLLAEARDGDTLSPQPLTLSPVAAPSGALRFPGKVKPVPGRRGIRPRPRWAVADTGHHQIVLLDDRGRETARFGSGEPGLTDGPADKARFTDPQGLIATADTIYVADTGNHAIRAIDLAAGTIATLAGIGRRGRPLTGRATPADRSALASPWDLAIRGDTVFFANAGTHQIGAFDRVAGTVVRAAGNGGESLVDGVAETAQLAQPSGLALSTDGNGLVFADSETSSVRMLDLRRRQVTTLVGTGLFDFGHINGPVTKARFQHPLGVAIDGDGDILVADSYNHTLRRIDVTEGTVADFDDGAYACRDPVCLPLGEPAGVWVDTGTRRRPGRVLLSDTNNHRILVYDRTRRTYRTWAS